RGGGLRSRAHAGAEGGRGAPAFASAAAVRQERTMQLNPYLNFNGQCKAAFEFYSECLGGKIAAIFTHGETPAAEHMPPEAHNLIMHARLEADGVVLMGSDAPPERYEKP